LKIIAYIFRFVGFLDTVERDGKWKSGSGHVAGKTQTYDLTTVLHHSSDILYLHLPHLNHIQVQHNKLASGSSLSVYTESEYITSTTIPANPKISYIL